MKSLRIAFLKNTLHSSGGLEKYCLRLFNALQARGHRVSILSTSSRKDLPVTKICSRLYPTALNMVWFDYHCRRYLQKHPVDIVFGFDRHFLPLTHYRAGNGCHAAFLARRSAEASLLKRLSLCLNPLHLMTRLSEHITFERSPPSAIICNSHLVEREILHFYPKTPPQRITVIHNGVEWEDLDRHFREKMEAPRSASTPPHLLFIGHEWERKGLDRLLKALSLIHDRPFHLTAVGRERHADRFERLAKELGIGQRVTLIPTSQPPFHFYRSANIAIIPSRYDPFANVTLEALAMGLFVITTKANGGSEVITSGYNGIVLEEGASEVDLSLAIASALPMACDPALPVAIRESVKEFDFSKKLNEYVGLIESGLSS